jgi:MscS family membrane protein
MGEKIINYGARDRILFQTTIGLTYGTTKEQLQYVVDEIKRMFLAHPSVFPDSLRVRFLRFGASSLDIDLLCWVLTTDYHAYTGIVEELNFRIMEVVERSGSSFAFPAQTIHFSRDERPDPEHLASIRGEIEQRREQGQLTIPEPTEEMRRRLREEGALPS